MHWGVIAGVCARANDPRPDGAKLSKRHGAVSVLQYQEEGYLPDALLNYLCAWAGHTGIRRFSRASRWSLPSTSRRQPGRRGLQPEKLLWLNQQHMMRAPAAVLAAGCARNSRYSGDGRGRQAA